MTRDDVIRGFCAYALNYRLKTEFAVTEEDGVLYLSNAAGDSQKIGLPTWAVQQLAEIQLKRRGAPQCRNT